MPSIRKGRRPPLLLLPGICCRGNVFGTHRGRGLAWHLEEYFQVTACDLRHPDSPAGGFDFDSHLYEDLPRLVTEATEQTGVAPWLFGHSMGAQLALAASALDLVKIRGIIALAPPCTMGEIRFYPPLMRAALTLGSFLGMKRVPVRLGARILFWWFSQRRAGRPSGAGSWRGLPRDLLLFHVMSRRSGFDVPLETLAQATRWVSEGVWCDRSGTRSYLEVLKNLRVPTLFIAGSKDYIASLEAVQTGYDRAGCADKLLVTIPGATHIGLLGTPFVAKVATATKDWVARYEKEPGRWHRTSSVSAQLGIS